MLRLDKPFARKYRPYDCHSSTSVTPLNFKSGHLAIGSFANHFDRRLLFNGAMAR
jgi:hypothetical protein